MREFTRSERRDIRSLVTGMCANYDREYGCLPLDGECYMLLKAQVGGGVCKYFKEAVLPLNPTLEAVLCCKPVDTKPCAMCGAAYQPKSNRGKYCEDCAKKAHRRQKAVYERKRRVDRGQLERSKAAVYAGLESR